MHDTPYWQTLLHYFELKGYFWNGLTIPFIIGSRYYIEPAKNLQSISELITEINNSPFYVSVLKCENIGEHVFSLCQSSDKKIYGGIDNLVILDNCFEKSANSSDIIKYLEMTYSGCINSGSFSKTDGEWSGYTDNEVTRLKETIINSQ